MRSGVCDRTGTDRLLSGISNCLLSGVSDCLSAGISKLCSGLPADFPTAAVLSATANQDNHPAVLLPIGGLMIKRIIFLILIGWIIYLYLYPVEKTKLATVVKTEKPTTEKKVVVVEETIEEVYQ